MNLPDTAAPSTTFDPDQDYYALLGLLPSAEANVIQAAYRALSRSYHPDHFEGEAGIAEARMAELNHAYAVLSDETLRQRYDEARAERIAQGGPYFSNQERDNEPNFDPYAEDWAVAIDYYPDLEEINQRFHRISWRLSYGFRAMVLELKQFDQGQKIADEIYDTLLGHYFGKDEQIRGFAKSLLERELNEPLAELNRAARVFGEAIDAARVIERISERFDIPNAHDLELISAIQEGDWALVKFLLEGKDANPDTTDLEGRPALELARSLGQSEIESLLLRAGARAPI